MTLGAQQEGAVCPVQIAGAYALLRPAEPGQWLLHVDGSPLTRFQFGAVLDTPSFFGRSVTILQEVLGGRMVRWLGRRGLRWSGFMDLVLGREQVWGRPEWLVVHLGGNDLRPVKGRELIWRIKGDMARIGEVWPGVRFVWSDIVPRQIWRDSRDVRALDRSRSRMNWAVSQFVVAQGGVAIRHPRLLVENREYFYRDGVHLSRSGTQVLLEDIFSFLA